MNLSLEFLPGELKPNNINTVQDNLNSLKKHSGKCTKIMVFVAVSQLSASPTLLLIFLNQEKLVFLSNFKWNVAPMTTGSSCQCSTNIQLPASIFMTFIKSCSIDSRNELSPIREVVHETSKVHFRNLLPNRFLPSSVGKALAWWSGGPGFNPDWGNFDGIFLLFPV